MNNCDYCKEDFESEDQLRTHILLKHREQAIGDGFSFEADVSDALSGESRAEKDEQFGYDRGY